MSCTNDTFPFVRYSCKDPCTNEDGALGENPFVHERTNRVVSNRAPFGQAGHQPDLQQGHKLAEIAASLMRLPDGKSASLVVAVVDRLLAIEVGKP